MDLSVILAWLSSLSPIVPIVLSILGSLLVIGTVYVALTPSQADDAWLAKVEAYPVIGTLIQALIKCSVIQRKIP